jgi:hypothetical protein
MIFLDTATEKKKAATKRVEQPVAPKANLPVFSLGKQTTPQSSPFASVAPTMPAKPIAIAATKTSFENVLPTGLFQMKPVMPSEPKVSIATTTGDSGFGSSIPTPSLSFGGSTSSLSFGTGSSLFGVSKSISEPPTTTISFGSVSKPLFGGSKVETTTPAAAPATLSFGAASVTKPVTDFSFAAISSMTSSASPFAPSKPVEIGSTPSFGAFEALPIKPTPTVSSSFGTPVAPLQPQSQPQAKPLPVKEQKQQHLVVNPVAVTLEKKSEEFTTMSKGQNKENSGPPLIEKPPLLSLLPKPPVTTNIEQNPPTIASPAVVSSADIKKPIATTSSSFSFGAAFSAANAAPPATTSIPSVSTTFSFAPPPPISAPTAASSFSFTSAAEKIAPPGVVDQNVNVPSVADNLFQGFNICSPTSTAPAANTSSIFGTSLSFSGTKSDSTTSIFGGGFGSTPATTAAAPSSIFGSIGGNAAGTTTSSTSFFGSMGDATSPTATSGASIFALPKPEQSVFGAPVSTPFSAQPTQAQGSSIFGGGGSTAAPFSGSAFSSPAGGGGGSIFSNNQPTSGSSIFASPSAFSSPTSGGSIFGNNNAGQTGGSIFGGGANQAPAFGQSATFSSPGGGFGQAGFGAPASFGAPPSFGQTGGFGQTPLSAGLSSPTQSNTLFEQLGASNAQGMTFGNLAQSANTEKPVFGGQQFSSWR